MTRVDPVPRAAPARPRKRRPGEAGRWQLQDAKARFSEVVRRARTVGPQHVSVHGREEVVVVAADEWRRLSGATGTGMDIVAALQASPYREVEIEPERWEQPIVLRDIEL